jgi:hypothetical protein
MEQALRTLSGDPKVYGQQNWHSPVGGKTSGGSPNPHEVWESRGERNSEFKAKGATQLRAVPQSGILSGGVCPQKSHSRALA